MSDHQMDDQRTSASPRESRRHLLDAPMGPNTQNGRKAELIVSKIVPVPVSVPVLWSAEVFRACFGPSLCRRHHPAPARNQWLCWEERTSTWTRLSPWTVLLPILDLASLSKQPLVAENGTIFFVETFWLQARVKCWIQTTA